MIYGHRNDPVGYSNALSYFDERIPQIIEGLREDDLGVASALRAADVLVDDLFEVIGSEAPDCEQV